MVQMDRIISGDNDESDVMQEEGLIVTSVMHWLKISVPDNSCTYSYRFFFDSTDW